MHTSNQNPPIVYRSARWAAHHILGGRTRLSEDKALAHRAYRRQMKSQLLRIRKGELHPDEFDPRTSHSSRLTGWDVA